MDLSCLRARTLFVYPPDERTITTFSDVIVASAPRSDFERYAIVFWIKRGVYDGGWLSAMDTCEPLRGVKKKMGAEAWYDPGGPSLFF